jgi:beta-1,4-mannosyl-glycoprotein beta-1,4-N-acetylglucosaminyltransferase
MGGLTTSYMKIFDCITFYRELELLDLRLMELYDVVDHFVIVEATRTHQGQPHEPVFHTHRERFAPYLDKIIHVLVEDLPVYKHQTKTVRSRTGYVPYADWRPEHFSRNAIQRGLDRGGAAFGDRILISDSDEIPSRDMVLAEAPRPENVAFIHDLYYYYINTKWVADQWHGTVMVTYGSVSSCQYARDHKRKMRRKVLDGIHCSYAGVVEEITAKLENFTHAHEYGSAEKTKLAQRRAALIDPLGRGPLTVVSPPAFHAMPAFTEKYPHFVYR